MPFQSLDELLYGPRPSQPTYRPLGSGATGIAPRPSFTDRLPSWDQFRAGGIGSLFPEDTQAPVQTGQPGIAPLQTQEPGLPAFGDVQHGNSWQNQTQAPYTPPGAAASNGPLPPIAPLRSAEDYSGIRSNAFQASPDPWGVDVSLAGLEANNRAHGLLDRANDQRLGQIAVDEEFRGDPMEKALKARQQSAQWEALRPLGEDSHITGDGTGASPFMQKYSAIPPLYAGQYRQQQMDRSKAEAEAYPKIAQEQAAGDARTRTALDTAGAKTAKAQEITSYAAKHLADLDARTDMSQPEKDALRTQIQDRQRVMLASLGIKDE